MGYGKTILGYKTCLLQWLLKYFDLDAAEKEHLDYLEYLEEAEKSHKQDLLV